jgi:sugar lactone lactonase YvrE
MARLLPAAILAALLAGATLLAAPGDISTYTGTGTAGFAGDYGLATLARINTPRGIAFDGDGNLYLADSANHRIRHVDAASGIITTIAGTGVAGFNADGILATSAHLNFPRGLVLDADGHLLIADSMNHRIRRIDSGTGLISTVVGTGVPGFNSDGIDATAALIREPAGLALAPDGDLVFVERSGNRVRRVDAATGTISTIAGTGTGGFNADGIAAVAALINLPVGVVVNEDGDVYVADTINFRVRRVDADTGLITTVAGTGTFGYNGDGIPAPSAQLMTPAGLAIDNAGHLLIGDMNGHRVRRVDGGTGLISTMAGTGTPGFNGDDQAAALAQLRVPDSLAINAEGHLFVGESGGARVRRIEGAPAATNTAPTAAAVLTFAGPVCGAAGGTLVQLDGSGSSDGDLDALTYTWTGPFVEGGGTVTGVSPTVTLPLGGPHSITLAVEDTDGAEDTDTAQITITDTVSPLLTIAQRYVTVTPGTGLMTAVDVLTVTGATAADACDPSPVLTAYGPELFHRGSTTVVTIGAVDASGNSVSTEVEITVEQGGRPDDPGPPAGKKPRP